MSSINIHPTSIPHTLAQEPASDAGLGELAVQQSRNKPLAGSTVFNTIADQQILQSNAFTPPTAAALESSINGYQPTTQDQQDLVEASNVVLNKEERKELAFDPGAWEKHANVLISAIIALNVSRVINAEKSGYFTLMASEAGKMQGAAIMEGGKAAVFTSIANAVISGLVAGFALYKTLQGQALRHADIGMHKQTALDATLLERDLKLDRAREDWNPETTYKIKTFDDFGRTTTVDFKPEGATLTPKEQAWFDAEILKAQNVRETSELLSASSSKSIDKRLEIGRALNAIVMSLSQVVSSLVRLGEHAAREKEVLQQSSQNAQKSTSEETGKKDSADAALLQKLMEIVMQLFQSRTEVIRAISS